MECSISSVFFGNLSCEDMVKAFIDCGFNCTEVSHSHVDYLLERGSGREFRRFIDDAGFKIPQGHLIYGTPGNITSSDNTYAIGVLKRNLDIFLELGVEAAVIHYSNYGSDIVPIEDYFECRVNALKELTDYVKGENICICLENLSRIHDYDAGHLLKMLKAVDSPNIGICLDTGHLNISQRGDQYHFIKQAGKHLKALHLNDNMGEHDGLTGLQCDLHMVPFDKGNICWEDVRRGLLETSYSSLLNFEVTGSKGAPIEIKKEQARYIKKLAGYFE